MDKFDANKDYYAILGATHRSTRREIERLYRHLARLHHPDRGGAEDKMKALNEAYDVLHDHESRRDYDARRRRPAPKSPRPSAAAPAREVGVHGQALSALLCILLGLVLLFLVRFNGLWFLWPMSILAVGVSGFGVIMAHSAMTNQRILLRASHPARRFRAAQELAFWLVVAGCCYGVYVILTAI